MLCSSYSGNTEETLACFAAAEALGARRIVASTGGALVEQARAAGVPVVGLPGIFQPRAAVAYMFTVAAEVAALAGAAPRIHTEIDAAAAFLAGAGRGAAARAPREIADAARGHGPGHLRRRPDRARSRAAGRPRSTRTPSSRPSTPSCPRPTTTRSAAGTARRRGAARRASSSKTATSTRASGAASS